MRLDAVTLHRWAHALWKGGVPIVPKLIDGVILILFNSAIHHRTVIGPGTKASHYGISIVVHKHSQIGSDVELGPHVVLGTRRGDDPGPIIEDNVFLGANCIVLGPVTIGRGAVIGAGALVLEDVPAGATVVGTRGRVLARGTTDG